MKKIANLLIALLISTVSYAQLSEGFESAPANATNGQWTMGSGTWYIFDNNIGITYEWERTPPNQTVYPANTGNYAALIKRENVPGTGDPAKDWLVSPAINLSNLTNPQLKFYSRLGLNGNQGTVLKVLLINANGTLSDLNSYVNLATWDEMELNPIQQEYNEIIVDIPINSSAGQNVRVAFYVEGDDADNWIIDDVSINSGCLIPNTLNISGLTTNSATLSWNSPGQNTQWQIEIVANNSPFTGNGTLISQNPYVATAITTGTGFAADSDYKYKVRSYCGPGDYSPWSEPKSFSTLAVGEGCAGAAIVPTALPYIKINETYSAVGLSTGAGGGCGSGSGDYLNHNYKIYSYTPTANTSINIKMSSAINKTAVFVYDGCASIGVNCYASAFDTTTTEKEINGLEVTAGHTYYIVVATTEAVSPFSIIINQNNCSNNIQANFTIYSTCTGSTFDAKAIVTSLGSASSVTAIIYKEGTSTTSSQTITAPGTITFSGRTGRCRILLKSVQNGNCNVLSKPLSLDLCPPTNDDCSNAIVLSTCMSGSCTSYQGKLLGATPSPEPSICPGMEDDDVWFEFVAVNTEHKIQITNVNGADSDINHAVYGGSDCGSLAQLYCSNGNASIATNLVIGETYKIRVYSATATPVEMTFNISTKAYPVTCLDTNPQSVVVRQLFVALLNHLITFSDSIDTSVTPYSCPELAALSEYITVPNPKIYNFSYNAGMLSFSFTPSALPDVSLNAPPQDENIVAINLTEYNSTTYVGNMAIEFTDGSELWQRNEVNKVNFCPETPFCNPVEGRIKVNPGNSCMGIGTPHVFTFQTEATNIASYSWSVYDVYQVLMASSQAASPVFSFDIEDTYIVKLTITDTNGCKTNFTKGISVYSNCSEFCTEVNPQSEEIKMLFLDLVNHLLDIYREGGSVTSPYTCPEMTALAPYVTDSNAKVYNISYVNSALKFSFYNHGSNYDILIKDNGKVVDIELMGWFDANYNAAPQTSYLNGSKVNSNRVKHVNFCPSTCPKLLGKITLNNGGVSCVSQNVATGFSFYAINSTVTAYSWTFYNTNGTSVFGTSTLAHPIRTYTAAGNYKVKLVVTYGNGCTATFNKLITVSSTCGSACTESNSQFPTVKEAYINLVNHLLSIYTTGNTVPNPYTCEELDALAPYLTDNDPKIWNISYVGNVLKFSFNNNGSAAYDVSVLAAALIEDISFVNYADNENYSSFATLLFNGVTPTTSHSVRHVNFCPETDGSGCGNVFGFITQGLGDSCTVVNTSQTFSLLTTVSGIASYSWTFYNAQGTYPLMVSESAHPTITYSSTGTYSIKLEVTYNNGCKSYFYKTVVVATSCDSSCTETNENTSGVKLQYIALLNHLLDLNGIIPEGYTCMQLSVLSQYLTDVSPAIYNVSYTNQVLSFSFSQGDSQPDVVIGDYGTIADINLYGFSSATSSVNLTVTYTNGTQDTNHSVKHVNFCPTVEPCESHVSFVIDESASITDDEITNIKRQLSNFIDQQEGTNMTISFVGMSDSDENTRTDHVYGKVTPENKVLFKNWINKYRSGYTNQGRAMGISPSSDYWASGLTQAYEAYALKPEIIIVLTDGSQTNDVEGLKSIVQTINDDLESHIYVYGIGNGFYVDQNVLDFDPNNISDSGISDVTNALRSSLKFLLELPATDFPVSGASLLATYSEHDNFNPLGIDLTYFSEELSSATFGCELFTVEYCENCETFQPSPGEKYWVSAWVKEEHNIQVKTYTNAVLKLVFEDGTETEIEEFWCEPKGEIIDGWQRIAAKFVIPQLAQTMRVELINNSLNIPAYFDDIRIHPFNGSMKSFVYDPETFRLMAELDDNNYSTFYEYDNEGGLIRIKKETSQGVKTIQESRSGNVIQPTN